MSLFAFTGIQIKVSCDLFSLDVSNFFKYKITSRKLIFFFAIDG